MPNNGEDLLKFPTISFKQAVGIELIVLALIAVVYAIVWVIYCIIAAIVRGIASLFTKENNEPEAVATPVYWRITSSGFAPVHDSIWYNWDDCVRRFNNVPEYCKGTFNTIIRYAPNEVPYEVDWNGDGVSMKVSSSS